MYEGHIKCQIFVCNNKQYIIIAHNECIFHLYTNNIAIVRSHWEAFVQL